MGTRSLAAGDMWQLHREIAFETGGVALDAASANLGDSFGFFDDFRSSYALRYTAKGARRSRQDSRSPVSNATPPVSKAISRCSCHMSPAARDRVPMLVVPSARARFDWYTRSTAAGRAKVTVGVNKPTESSSRPG